jgi:hypothetical protein
VNLSPPTTMLAALVGGAAVGVPGAIIGTPLVGTIKGLYLEYRGIPMEPSKRKKLSFSFLRRLRRRAGAARAGGSEGQGGTTP